MAVPTPRLKFRRTAPLAAVLLCLEPQASQALSDSASASISLTIPALVQITEIADVSVNVTPGHAQESKQTLCIQHNNASRYTLQLKSGALRSQSGDTLAYTAGLEQSAPAKKCAGGDARTLAVKFRADDTGRAIAGVYTGALTVTVVAE